MADGPVDAVTVTHNETSTGVLNPVAEIAAVVRELSPDTLVMVDAVSSFAGTPIPFDDWKLDVCVTSSQKALALPPGLAFAAVSDRMLERAAGVEGRGWYFDFLNLEKSLITNTTPATPAISLMRALDVELDHIFDGRDGGEVCQACDHWRRGFRNGRYREDLTWPQRRATVRRL